MPLVEAASDLMLATVLCADENRRGLEHLLGQDSFGEVLGDETHTTGLRESFELCRERSTGN